jgi:hypothetical protein
MTEILHVLRSGMGVLGLLLILTSPAAARPPPDGSLAAQRLEPYAGVIQSLTQPGTGLSCCDLSDCRMVDPRIGANGRYEVLIAPYNPQTGDGFPRGPGRYLEVPPEVIIPPGRRHDLPFSVACWAKWSVRTNGFLCFLPGLGS